MDQLSVAIAGEIALSKDPGGSMKKWREIFGINQLELAKHLKISSSTISDYEGGRIKSPGIGVVSRLVETLLEIDRKKGGQITKQLEREFKPKESAFDVHEFSASVKGLDFAERINAQAVANPAKLKDVQIYGYSMIDSIKAIIFLPLN